MLEAFMMMTRVYLTYCNTGREADRSERLQERQNVVLSFA